MMGPNLERVNETRFCGGGKELISRAQFPRSLERRGIVKSYRMPV